MFGAVMRMERKKENHGRSPTQLRKHAKKSTDLSFNNVQSRYNLDLPARPDALTYSGGVARSTGVGRGHRSNKSNAGKRVAIIQRKRNNVIQRCGPDQDNHSGSGTGKKSGETSATAMGKRVHAKKAADRRASGKFDIVNEAMRDDLGQPIMVARSINRKTGAPSAKMQRIIPDAVQGPGKGEVIIDDKPADRPIDKDFQEMRRNASGYQSKYKANAKKYRIERYDPKTGEDAGSEEYSIAELMQGKLVLYKE